MIRWSAHLHLLFTDRPLIERFAAAADAGFNRVEMWSAFDVPVQTLIAAAEAAGVHVGGFNLLSGDMSGGDRGYLNLPDQRDAILAHAEEALNLAQRLGSETIHALVGNSTGAELDAEVEIIEERLHELATLAKGTGVTFLVEPLNPTDNPRYVLQELELGAQLVARLDHPNIGLLFDVYHVACMGLDVAAQYERHHALVRHVQIADAPGRHAPGTGTIPFRAFFERLTAHGYEGTVGLEYTPRDSESSEEALAWLPIPDRKQGSASFPISEVLR